MIFNIVKYLQWNTCSKRSTELGSLTLEIICSGILAVKAYGRYLI